MGHCEKYLVVALAFECIKDAPHKFSSAQFKRVSEKPVCAPPCPHNNNNSKEDLQSTLFCLKGGLKALHSDREHEDKDKLA